MTVPFKFRLMLSALLLAACGGKATPEGEGPPAPSAGDTLGGESSMALPVVGDEVTVGDLILSVNATGQVSSEAIASVRAEVSGTVEEVLVQPGDHVEAGQALVRLDTRLLDLDRRQAEASLASARLAFTNALLDDSLNRVISSPERTAMLRTQAGLENQEVALERIRLNLEHSVVRAPYAGVVERVAVVPGDRISSGQEMAVVVDLTRLRIEARVMEQDIPSIRSGGTAEITIGAVPGKPIRGSITAVLPLIDSVQKFGHALIRFRGDGVIRPGMFASVRLEANRLHNQTLVPNAAIVERQGRPLVFVVRNGLAEWVYVAPGAHNFSQTAILPDSATGMIPLKAGDVVLVSGHLTMSHLAPVQLLPKQSDPSKP